MKKSLNAWTVDSKTGFEQMFRELKEAGFDGVELNVDKEGSSEHSLTLSTTAEDLAKIKAISEKYDLPVISISTSLWGGCMGTDPEFSEKLLKQQLFCADYFGAKGILVVPGGAYPKIPLLEDRKGCIEFLKSQRKLIESYGIYVGVENVWNMFFGSPLDMVSFIDEVDNPLVGAYYDVGNVIAFSWSERWIEVLGSRIHNIHVKDYKRNRGVNSGGVWADIPYGDVNWKAVIPALREAGFDGYLTGEVFKEDPEQSYQDYYAFVARGIEEVIKY
ncbi:MAG: sugar phosphate isomerase/epimerase [Firmicutes bacterium]|nr:sugar phosphate isomerase/epimerase [Bacillota bacterium]